MSERWTMIYIQFIFYFLLLLTIPRNIYASSKDGDVEEVTLDYKDIYRDDHKLYRDPKNMLEDPIDKLNSPHDLGNLKVKERCVSDKKESDEAQNSLAVCAKDVKLLKSELELEKEVSSKLNKKILDQNRMNINSFYFRIMKNFHNLFEMKSMESFVSEGDDGVIRRVRVTIGYEDMKSFSKVLEKMDIDSYQQIDGFFRNNWSIEPLEELDSVSESVFAFTSNVIIHAGDFDVWLKILWIIFGTILTWALILFVKDIGREFRWIRLFVMMMILIFIISCVMTWKSMLKKAESRHVTYMMQMNITDIPASCMNAPSIWERVGSWFGQANSCEMYHKQIVDEPGTEITPLMVISETLSVFILHPLPYLGNQVGSFFGKYLDSMPYFYWLPTSFLLPILLVVVLFFTCGYGIHVPFSGIKPIHKPVDSSDDVKKLMEAHELLKAEHKSLLNKSHDMLQDISRAAIEVSQNSTNVCLNPIISNSAGIIEKKLEEIINQKLSNILVGTALAPSPLRVEQRHVARSNSFNISRADHLKSSRTGHVSHIDTITSTPLFDNYRPIMKDKVDGSPHRRGSLVEKENMGYKTPLFTPPKNFNGPAPLCTPPRIVKNQIGWSVESVPVKSLDGNTDERLALDGDSPDGFYKEVKSLLSESMNSTKEG